MKPSAEKCRNLARTPLTHPLTYLWQAYNLAGSLPASIGSPSLTSLWRSTALGVTRLQTEQTKVGNQATALNSMKTKMADIQTSLAALSTPPAAFTQRTASASNSLWKVSAQPTAAPVTHTIAVTKLATTAGLRGAGGISSAIRPDGDASQVLVSAMNLAQPITAGQFSVNGAKVTVAITDTLADVFQKISDATGGAVTASYNGTHRQDDPLQREPGHPGKRE